MLIGFVMAVKSLCAMAHNPIKVTLTTAQKRDRRGTGEGLGRDWGGTGEGRGGGYNNILKAV